MRPIESTRTSSPYFSPNRAMAPAEMASSGVISRVVTGTFERDASEDEARAAARAYLARLRAKAFDGERFPFIVVPEKGDL